LLLNADATQTRNRRILPAVVILELPAFSHDFE
jgi:hypothetical protein